MGSHPEAVEKILESPVSMASSREHATFTFAMRGLAFLTPQLVRHCMGSLASIPTYFSEKSSFDYVIPQNCEIPAAKEEYLRAMENAQASYDVLADLLIAKHKAGLLAKGMGEKQATSAAEKMGIEDARYVLPNGCETKIVVTMNVREMLHIFNVR